MLSQIADKPLIRSVYKLVFSDINGSLISSYVESRDEINNPRAGSERRLRSNAIQFLKNNIGWINSAGKLVEGTYPNIELLFDGLRAKQLPMKLPITESQPFLSLKTSSTMPGSRAVTETGKQKLCNSTREAGVVISNPHGQKSPDNGTDKAFLGNNNGTSALNNNKYRATVMSASLHDGTLVVLNLGRCQQMSRGERLGFQDILRIISQWRAQTHQDIDDEQCRKPLLIHVRPNTDSCFEEIDVLRRGEKFIERSATRWKLHHTVQMPNCSFVKAEAFDVSLPNKTNLRQRNAALGHMLRRGLQNHVGAVDDTGFLRMNNQPTIHEAYYEMEKPFRFRSTALSIEHVDTDHAEARHTPLEPTDNEKAEKGLSTTPENTPERTQKDDDNRYPAHEIDHSIIVSATLHDGSLVVPSYKLCKQMSTGIGKSFSDILRIISQWRTQTCRNNDHVPKMIYVYTSRYSQYFSILTFDSDIQTLRSDISALHSHSRLLKQPMTRIKLYHTPGTTESSYVHYRCVRNDQSHSIERMQKLLDIFESALKNHVGVMDETGSLRKGEHPTAHEVLSDPERPSEIPDVPSVRRKDTKPPRVKYTPPEPTHDGKPEKKPENELDKLLENVQGISMHDQIASTMKLAGALFEMSIMLNEEMSNAPSQTDDNTSFSESDSNLINEPNPVFRTMRNGEVDIDAVQKAMADFRTRLGDHQDKAQILAHVCRRWKEELEARYPMMKRKSVTHNDVDDLLSPRSTSATLKSRATRKAPSSKPKEQRSPTKVRSMIGNSELKLASTKAGSKEDKQPDKQQDKFSNDRGGTQPYSRFSDGSNHGRSKNDDGFSISSW